MSDPFQKIRDHFGCPPLPPPPPRPPLWTAGQWLDNVVAPLVLAAMVVVFIGSWVVAPGVGFLLLVGLCLFLLKAD